MRYIARKQSDIIMLVNRPSPKSPWEFTLLMTVEV